MNTQAFTIEFICPHCGKSKIFADQSAEVKLSCQCANCKKFYIANLKTKRVEKASARASPNAPRKPPLV